ncbi:uncharacterized protein LOC143836608 [Paroedura picta]|uniref:uncharacterized protein LOC143836608 n=1 Tax=Paroedura picta TaxID=143630 RepID=UPI004056D9C2
MENIMQQSLSVVDDNMCSLLQSTFEGIAGEALGGVVSKGLQPGTNVCIQNMKEDEDKFCYLMDVSKDKKEEQGEKHCAEGKNIQIPNCEMGGDAIIHIFINITDVARIMEQSLSEKHSEGGSQNISNVHLMDGPEGKIMTYSTNLTKCKNEDRSDCKTYSADCSTGMTMAPEGNELVITSTTEGCNKDTQPEPHLYDKESVCHETSCKLKGVRLPMPMNIGVVVKFQVKNCQNWMHFEMSSPLSGGN